MKNLLLVLLLLTSVAFGKVYDCFMFFNELDVLEIRLNELYDHVDKFVLVESSETHRTGHPKPYYFEENKERFEKFADKIIHIKLDEHIGTQEVSWVRENWQRNQIMRGLTDCEPEDLIFISDADEFIPGSIIPAVNCLTAKQPMVGFHQILYSWFLNRLQGTCDVWAGSGAIRYKHLKIITPQEFRVKVRCEQMPMYRTGWHFNSMGGYEHAILKYYSIVEGHDNFMTYEQWRGQVNNCPLVSIDTSYPKFVQENLGYLVEIGFIDVP